MTIKIGDIEVVGQTILSPNTNIVLQLGENDMHISFQFHAKKTFLNRIKYWLFCKFFPFKIANWEDVKASK